MRERLEVRIVLGGFSNSVWCLDMVGYSKVFKSASHKLSIHSDLGSSDCKEGMGRVVEFLLKAFLFY